MHLVRPLCLHGIPGIVTVCSIIVIGLAGSTTQAVQQIVEGGTFPYSNVGLAAGIMTLLSVPVMCALPFASL